MIVQNGSRIKHQSCRVQYIVRERGEKFASMLSERVR